MNDSSSFVITLKLILLCKMIYFPNICLSDMVFQHRDRCDNTCHRAGHPPHALGMFTLTNFAPRSAFLHPSAFENPPLCPAELSKPKLNQQRSSTEFEVRLHSYPVIHHPLHTNSTCILRQQDFEFFVSEFKNY